MKLSDFNTLEDRSKINFTWDKGIVLRKMVATEAEYYLYRVYDFYTKLRYDRALGNFTFVGSSDRVIE